MGQHAPPWKRYAAQIYAVNALARIQPTFARESAAQILGLPLSTIPTKVQTVVSTGLAGGQSSRQVRRLPRIDGDPIPWLVTGVFVTPPHITARDLAVDLPLTQSLPTMDAVVSQMVLPSTPPGVKANFSREDILVAISRLPSASQRTRAARVLDVANGQSQSAGESISRAIMIEHNFSQPALQIPVHDSAGLIGYPDFLWEELKVIGEFDGYEKYSAQKYLQGKTPSRVVVEEKRREDRLRALGYTVVRWGWKDVVAPKLLIALLESAGVQYRSA